MSPVWGTCRSRFGMMAVVVESVIDITVFTFCCPIYCCQVDCDQFVFQSRKFELLNEYKSIFGIDIDFLVTLEHEDGEKRSPESISWCYVLSLHANSGIVTQIGQRLTLFLSFQICYSLIVPCDLIQSDFKLLSGFSWSINGNLDNNLDSSCINWDIGSIVK
jgi:hypothetical protein